MHTRTQKDTMISQQVRTWNVVDNRILDAMSDIPRDSFTPSKYKDFAYADMLIPIKSGQVMLSPQIQGRLLQALSVTDQDHVLEIGTGTGYLSAVLGKLAKDVISVDVLRSFSDDASLKMVMLGVNNVRFQTGDASNGWDKGAPYDAILISGSLPCLPEGFKNTLAVGGRLVCVVGEGDNMQAIRVERISNSDWETTSLFDTVVPPLKNVPSTDVFEF